MDLVLWRHAEAHDAAEGETDLERVLTPKGVKQAARAAKWLLANLPGDARIYSSPAVRTVQTAKALGRSFKLRSDLAPDGCPLALRTTARWPNHGGTTVVVGHQPTLGQVIAQLMGLQAAECSVKKGAVWWLRKRERNGVPETVLVAVFNPDMP